MSRSGARNFFFGSAFGIFLGIVIGASLSGTPQEHAPTPLEGSTPIADAPSELPSEMPQPELDQYLDPLGVILTFPDTADGVEVYACFTNVSDRAIKYTRLTLRPYNAVDDPVSSSIGNASAQVVRHTGPLAPGNFNWSHWGPVWYNGTISYAILEEVSIEFDDGEIVTISGLEVRGDMRGHAGRAAIECDF